MTLLRTTTGTSTDLTDPEASSQVAKAFDTIAEIFDSTLENETTRRLREKIYSIVETFAKTGSTLLDINCGTGIDAMRFLEVGYRVTGVDISPGMIAAAQKKISPNNIEKTRFFVSTYDDLSSHFPESFDVVFSNFGGLNCSTDLSATAKSISAVTKPGGYFVGVLMPSFSIWEFLSFALRFRWSDAFRRFHSNSPATGFQEKSFPVYYYSPGIVSKAFSFEYDLKKVIGLSILSPTPQSVSLVRGYPRLSELLIRIDDKIEGIPLIRSIGDHYIIVLRKRQ